MKRPITVGPLVRYSVFFILAILITLPATLPTELAVRWGKSYLYEGQQADVALYDYYGTLVNGGARLVTYQNNVVGGVKWGFDFRSLFTGGVLWDFEIIGDEEIWAVARGGVNFFGYKVIEAIEVDLPIYKIGVFLPAGVPYVDGKVKVELYEVNLDVGGAQFSATGKIELDSLQLGRGEGGRLGAFTATIKKDGAGSKVLIKQVGRGVVNADLIINIAPTGAYQINGTVEANENAGMFVKTFLAWMGKRKGRDSFKLAEKGNVWKVMSAASTSK